MGFLQSIQKSLQESLAEQQRAALVQLLRQRAATMTFDDLRELLASPLGRGLGALRVVDVFGTAGEVPAAAPAAEPRKARAKKSSAPAAGPVERDRERKAKSGKKTAKKASSKGRKPQTVEARVANSTGSKPAAEGEPGRRSPPGVSAEKRAEIDRYDASILAAVHAAGDWVAAGDVRARVGGTSEALRLALKRLTERRAIVREGERAQTRYKAAG